MADWPESMFEAGMAARGLPTRPETDRKAMERVVREELVRSGMPGRPNRLAEDIVTRILELEQL